MASSKSKGKGKSPSVRVSNEPEEMVNQSARVEGPVVELTLDKLRVEEGRNLRKFPPSPQSIRDLANSILTQGLINPVIVYPVPENGDGATHQLDAGYQRVKALQLLAEEGNPVPIRATVISGPSEGINLDENLQRMNLSLMDQAYILKDKVDAGMGKGEAGKLLGLGNSTVTRLLKLVGLRQPIQDKIHKGQVPMRVIMLLPDLKEKDQDELLADLARPGESVSSKTDKARNKKVGRKGKQGRKKAKSSGVTITDLYAAVSEQMEEVRGKDKPLAAETKAEKLYDGLRKFLAGGMSMKALHKRVLTLVAPR